MIKLHVSYSQKLTEVTEVILENLEKYQGEDRFKYLKFILSDIDENTIDAHWIDFGLAEPYIDAAKEEDELNYWRNRPL